jgi:hypothetical protein
MTSQLFINISSDADGKLTIELPMSLIESKKQGTDIDDAYVVFIDGQYVAHDELVRNSTVRIYAIKFNSGCG